MDTQYDMKDTSVCDDKVPHRNVAHFFMRVGMFVLCDSNGWKLGRIDQQQHRCKIIIHHTSHIAPVLSSRARASRVVVEPIPNETRNKVKQQ